jgi:hypothetical protein
MDFQGGATGQMFSHAFDVGRGQILTADEPLILSFDFRSIFPPDFKGRADIGYSLIVCASDLSRSAIATYYHHWPIGSTFCRLKIPWTVRVKFWKQTIHDIQFNPSVPSFIRRHFKSSGTNKP